MADHEVIKHHAAIHISNTLTLLQRKLSNVLLKNAYEHLLDRNRHKIKVNDLTKALGFNSNDELLLKSALTTLTTTALQWNVLGKDKTHEWEVTAILAWAKLKKGVCEYEYSTALREMLINPNIYARLNLLSSVKFAASTPLRFGNTLWGSWP